MSAYTIKPENGRVVGDPEQLKLTAAEAVRNKEYKRATHMYTLAIDLLVPATKDPNSLDLPSLDAKSSGLLHVLLSNRSFTHFKCEDFLAAAEDAENCCQACPSFVKGHLRLLAALSSGDEPAPITSRIKVVVRGLRVNPTSKPLILAKEALVKESSIEEVLSVEAKEAEIVKDQLKMTKDIADDEKDERHIIAAGDYGTACAVGAYGLDRDVVEAEKYLKIASNGGDIAAIKNYGHLLLTLNRPVEASAQFAKAVEAGDAEAGDILRNLGVEADQKRDAAMDKLRELADAGDERAIEMLKTFQTQMQQQKSQTP